MSKDKIKICHVTSAHKRYDTRIFQKECTSLSNMGYEVYLLVNDEIEDEMIKGVKIISTKFMPRNRLERFVKTKKNMLEIAIKLRADVYHFHDPDLIGLALTLKKRRPSVNIIFDSHEDVPAQILEKKWLPMLLRKPVSKLFEIYQKNKLPRFDYLIGVTPHLVKKLKKINNKTEMITNYPLLDKSIDALNQKSFVSTKKEQICFAGGISRQWNHDIAIQSLAGLDIRYVLCGSFENENYFEYLKKIDGWNKVDYLGKIPFEEVQDIYKSSKIGLALLSYQPNTDYKQGTLGNTKIFEYMQAGIPLICTDFVLWEKIVKKYHCGICVNPLKQDEVANAVQYLIENPDEADKMGNNGKKLVREKFNWNQEEKKLFYIYEELIRETKRETGRE